MDGNLILSLLLVTSVVILVVGRYRLAFWRDMANMRGDDMDELRKRSAQTERECQQYKDELMFQKQYLLQLAQKEVVAILNDGQAAQLINTIAAMVNQNKQGVN